MKKSVLLLLSCLLWSIASLAQHPVGIWKSGVPTIINVMDSIVFSGKQPTSPDAVGVWYNGDITMHSGVDSVVFNSVYLDYPDGLDMGKTTEPTETETFISQLSADEEEAVATVFTAEEKEQYDAMAEELLAMFDTDDSEARQFGPWRADDAEYASEVIRKNGSNNVLNELKVEQPGWNCGKWGPTEYGGFKTFFRTFIEGNKRYILIVFKKDGGFQKNARAYVKLGQLNNGKPIGKLGKGAEGTSQSPYVPIAKGQEYVYQRVCIDDFLKDYGYLTLFPLIITEVNGKITGERNYINPIFIHSNPDIVPKNWRFMHYGEEFGKVNGVPVYCNTWEDEKTGKVYWYYPPKRNPYECWNIHGDEFQCVELCKRYIIDFYKMWAESYPTGNANEWEKNRKAEPDNFTVYPNDGTHTVREGDFIIWDSDGYGHIGIIFRTGPDYVKVAHQNGYNGTYADPINTTLTIENGVIKDHYYHQNFSPVNKVPQKIPCFIRVNWNENAAPVITPDPEPEPEPEPVKAMTCDVTSLDFGETTVGTERKLVFNVTNTGETTLTISSVSLQSGSVFSVSQGPASLGKGVGQGYNVTFKPTQEGTFTDKITIRTDAKDHPVWTITLSGKATVAEQWGEKKMVCSGVSDNTQYTLYKQPNLAKYRTNSAGTKFYQTRLIVDVTYQGVTVSSPVTSDVYVDPNGAQSIMALTYQGSMDSGMGMLVVFTSSKAEGNNNLMNGYAYITGYQSRTPMRMFFSTEQTEHVFENKNYGWYPTFFYDDSGTLAVRHFCPDNNKIIESYYDYPVWESYEMGTTTKSDYENFWKNLRKPQFLEQPDMPWY